MRRVVGFGVALALLGAAPEALAQSPTDSAELRRAVTVEGVLAHERELQRIAERNQGTRVAGTAGYDASARYVARRLRLAGYRVTAQPFDFPFFQEREPARLSQVSPTARDYGEADFLMMDYSGSGDVTATVQPVDLQLPPGPTANSSTSGCEATDFAGFEAGRIALLQRGTCTFGVKAGNAAAAGAAGVIVFNEGQEGRTALLAGATLGEPGFTIPVVFTGFALGEELAAASAAGTGVTVRMFTSTVSETRRVSNVIGDTRGGRADRVVVAGAHLDSVSAGPGINDNGSGSSTILEIAEQMAALIPEPGESDPDAGEPFTPRNRVRFAFWGAEEQGLLGSAYYVSQLSAEERARIGLNLNFDMLGSTNFVRFVYDGDTSDYEVGDVPAGSDEIERVFLDYFSSQRLATEPTPFDGRSDYGSFLDAGIPAGGLFSGAEGVKTPAQALVYGGTAGTPYDRCYHLACDTVDNLSRTSLSQLGDGAAHAVLTFAERDAPVRSGVEPPTGLGGEKAETGGTPGPAVSR